MGRTRRLRSSRGKLKLKRGRRVPLIVSYKQLRSKSKKSNSPLKTTIKNFKAKSISIKMK